MNTRYQSLLRGLASLCVLACCVICSENALASDSTAVDTVKVYELGEVIASGSRGSNAARVESADFQRIPHREIKQRDALSVSELAPVVSAARVQTNSRGESLLFLRGAGERQIALFMDGAMLNIPWDNRVDLSLIPSDLIGQMTVAKGAGSLLYGPNILGGVVNLATLERRDDGYGGVARLAGGETERSYSILVDGGINDFNFIVFNGRTNSDGYLLPAELAEAGLDNQNPESRRRTNTGFDRVLSYARIEYDISEATTLGFSVNDINAEKCVAAETHRGERARYWRYPEWNRTMMTLNARHVLDARGNQQIRATIWLDLLDQTIDSYRDETFASVEERELGEDVTMGGRVTFGWSIDDNQQLNFALYGYDSRHDEEIQALRDSTFPGGETVSIVDESASAEYGQRLGSAGVEYLLAQDSWSMNAGVSFDAASNPKAGVFPVQDGQTDIGLSLGGRYELTSAAGVYASVARRTRFPTPREQFSGALGKFIPNPDLQAESGLLTELGGDLKFSDIKVEGALFYNRYADGIAKEKLSDGRERRINLTETLVTGGEVALWYFPVSWLDLSGNMTYMHSRGKTDDGFDQELEYRPVYLAGFLAQIHLPANVEFAFELESIGAQYGDNATTGEFEQLDAFTLMNTRVSWKFLISRQMAGSLFLRVNNIADAVSYSQLGIPGAGRSLRGGTELVF